MTLLLPARPGRRPHALIISALGAAVTAWCLSVGSSSAQVPTLPPSPDTTVPAPTPPPDQGPAPVPDPAAPPAPPTTGTPGTPAPATPGAPGASKPVPTTAPASGALASDPTPGSRPATFSSSAPGLDLSEIDALRRQARGRGPRPAEADGGFASALPYGPDSAQAANSSVADSQELGRDESRLARIRSLGAFAGGLVSLVLLGLAVSTLRRVHGGGPLSTGR